ncbi:hypothetical protein [Oxynema aestuarii]|jgi:hypothetical protein|uniref:hypothetical protein n=1 Tax=Oxynema aestuarii TaxID=2874213 RepID=UPI001B30758E|nr:hypothetical protein [Oxynema aestuarii]
MILLLHGLANDLASAIHWGEWLSVLNGSHFPDASVLAQQVNDPDILGRIQRTWMTFVKTGQIWAFIIGAILGYVFRGITGT